MAGLRQGMVYLWQKEIMLWLVRARRGAASIGVAAAMQGLVSLYGRKNFVAAGLGLAWQGWVGHGIGKAWFTFRSRYDSQWNDGHGRTKEEVVAALQKVGL